MGGGGGEGEGGGGGEKETEERASCQIYSMGNQRSKYSHFF